MISMSSLSPKQTSIKTQQVCIDLPGEAVQCWRSADKLQILLRKHRDVVFDIRIGDGEIYTVESTESDFYNARDKKLISCKKSEKVTFSDGERLHLWISRDFKGNMILRSKGKIISRFEPNKLDPQKYGDSPRAKPAPFILALTGEKNKKNGSPPKKSSADLPTKRPDSIKATSGSECGFVCVVEGKMEGAPDKVMKYFQQGGSKSIFDLDMADIATRNWVWGQIAGTAAYIGDNWEWLRASVDGKTHEGIRFVSAKISYVRGKVRYYFSGYSKYNTVFGPGGYGAGNERIMSIFAGSGKTSASFTAIGKGVAGSLKGNALISFIFSSAVSLAEWKSDVKKDGYDLAATLFTGLLKTLVVASLVTALVALIVMVVMVALGASLSVLMIGAVAIAAGFAISYGIDFLDKKLAAYISSNDPNINGMADIIAPYLRNAFEKISENWDYLMKKFDIDYKEIIF